MDILSFILPHVASFFALFLGVVLHFLTELKNLKISPKQYWTNNPYQTLICLVGALIGYMLLLESHETRLVYYVGYGFICNTIPNIIGQRAGISINEKVEEKK